MKAALNQKTDKRRTKAYTISRIEEELAEIKEEQGAKNNNAVSPNSKG